MASQPGNTKLRAALSAAGVKRLTDRELLAQFCEGDQSAFAAIVKRHTGMVLGVCRRVLPIVQDAEDACQVTFLVLARKAKSGRWQNSIANWLYITARRIALTENRAATRRMKRQSPSSPAAVSALDEMTGREAFAALDEELDRLPAIYREPMVLFYLQGLTRNEAATRLGIASTTLKSRLDRGRKKLAEALSKRGIDVGAGLMAIAAISSAQASSQRLFDSILATVGGSPSASVVAIAQGVTVNGFSLTAKLLVLAIAAAVVGFGVASMPIATEQQKPAIERAKQVVTKEYVNSNIKWMGEQPAAKVEEPPKYKPIDPETIAAYEKLGAIYGGFEIDNSGGNYKHLPGKDAAAQHLPGFSFATLPNDMIPKLPPVQVAFGLSFGCLKVTDAGLRELRGLKNLTGLDLGFTQVTDVGLKELKNLKNLTTLNLNFTQVTDEGLKELKDLKNLATLYLMGTKTTGRGLKDFKNLTTLYLFETRVADEGLKELKDLKNLTMLTLNFTQVTNEGIKGIKDLKNLTTLSLSSTRVTDAGLKEIKDLKNLVSLALIGTNITDEGLKELKELKNLSEICLMGTRVTDDGFKELKELENLTNLDLRGTSVTGIGFRELKDLKNLSELWLNDTKVTDAGLMELNDLRSLTKLVLDGTKVTDTGINNLKNLKKLKWLELHGTEVTGGGLHEFEDLTTLYLTGSKMTDEGLKELKDLKNLTKLELDNTKVTDEGVKQLKDLKNLTRLGLDHTNVTNEGLKQLKNLKNLASLSLDHTKVTDEGISQLKDLKNLTSLGLRDTQVTDKGLKELKDIKSLTSLILTGTHVTDEGLKELKDFKNLTWLQLTENITEAGLKDLKTALPKCAIIRGELSINRIVGELPPIFP